LKKEERAVGVGTKSSHFASSADLGGGGGGGVYLQGDKMADLREHVWAVAPFVC
jgi:hypothetical protein